MKRRWVSLVMATKTRLSHVFTEEVSIRKDIAVVVINRTDEPASSYHFGQMQVLTTARNIILNATTYRLIFKNHDGNKVARIVHSSCHPEGEAIHH
jgi:hypothetical protein